MERLIQNEKIEIAFAIAMIAIVSILWMVLYF